MKYLVGWSIAFLLCMCLTIGCNQNKDVTAAPAEQGEPPMFPEETVPKAEPAPAPAPLDATAMEPAPAPKPAPKESYAEPKAPRTYVIKKGDTLQKISEKFYGTTKKFDRIYEANKDVLKDKNTLKVGTKIKIPD